MFHKLLSCALLLPAALFALRGSIVLDSFPGPVTQKMVRHAVYLPEGYANGNTRYPVVYHFHGMNGTFDGAHLQSVPGSLETAHAAGLIRPCIIVFPDGYRNSMWADSRMGDKPAETNIIRELIPRIDSLYRTLTERRYRLVSGFSMGGFGAAKFMAKFPNLFSGAAIYDGALMEWPTFLQRHADLAVELFNNKDSLFNQYSPYYWLAQNAPTLAATVKCRQNVGAIVEDGRNFRDSLMAHGVVVDYLETGCSHNIGCMLDSSSQASWTFLEGVMVSQATELEKSVDGKLSFRVSPNPFNPDLNIVWGADKSRPADIRIYNVNGIRVHRTTGVSTGQYVWQPGNLASGVYLVTVHSAGSVLKQRVVYER